MTRASPARRRNQNPEPNSLYAAILRARAAGCTITRTEKGRHKIARAWGGWHIVDSDTLRRWFPPE